jgi:Recombination endonuclease VII
MVQEQSGNCALCSEPGSAGGLVIDTDDLRKSIRGLVHRKCKTLLALGRDDPRRFQMAIIYLEQRSAAPARLIGKHVPVAIPKSLG